MSAQRVIKKWANDEQQWFVERGAAPTLLAGGINSGKTAGACLKALILLHQYPGSRLAIVRRSQTQLLKTTAETFYQWCLPAMYRPAGKKNETELTLNNGSKVFFVHLDQPNSLDLLAGLELNFGYVSQAEEISEKAWDLLDVRIGRWTGATIPQEMFDAVGGRDNWEWRNEQGDCVPPRYFFAESYVTDEAHFLYDRFAPESPNRAKWAALGYDSRIVWSESNIYAIKQTIQASLNKDDDYIRRYVRPQWGNPEGKIFRVDPLSILEPDTWLIEKIKRTMKLHRAMDYGDFAPTAVGWLATDYDKNIFAYREYYVADELISTHRRAIHDLSMDDFGVDSEPRYHSNIADPSIFSVSRGRTALQRPSWSIADEWSDTRMMERETAIRWRPAENDEAVTMSRLKEYLRIDPNHHHPVTRQKGAPHLYFIKSTSQYPNGCKNVLKDVRAQTRKRSRAGDREIWLDQRDDTVTDHGYDMLKYFVVGRPPLGDMVELPPLEPGDIRVQQYEAMDEFTRVRKRRDERRGSTTGTGYGR